MFCTFFYNIQISQIFISNILIFPLFDDFMFYNYYSIRLSNLKIKILLE